MRYFVLRRTGEFADTEDSAQYTLETEDGESTGRTIFVTLDDAIDRHPPVERLTRDLYDLHQVSHQFEDGDVIVVETDGDLIPDNEPGLVRFVVDGIHVRRDTDPDPMFLPSTPA